MCSFRAPGNYPPKEGLSTAYKSQRVKNIQLQQQKYIRLDFTTLQALLQGSINNYQAKIIVSGEAGLEVWSD